MTSARPPAPPVSAQPPTRPATPAPRPARERVALAVALAVCALGLAMFLMPATRSGGSAYEQLRATSDRLFPLVLAVGGIVSAGSVSRFPWAGALVVLGSFVGWLAVEVAFGLAFRPGVAGLDIITALSAMWDCVAPFAIGVLLGVAGRALPGWLRRPVE